MMELLHFTFFQHAILATLLVSIACGLIGTLIMVNRMVSMAGGITHGAFGGIGIAFYFSLPILLSTSVFTLFLSFLIAYLMQKYPHRSDNIIAVIWAFGMVVGLILIDLTPGFKSDLMAYLFGSVLAVSSEDLWLMLFCDLIFIVLIVSFYRQFEALSFDREFAQLRGVNTTLFHYLLVAMMSFCIIISIRVVGLILVIALLSIPCFIAEHLTKKLGSLMFLSSILSAIFCIAGLFMSYFLDISSGASIIALACMGFFVFFAIRQIAIKYKNLQNIKRW